MSYGRVDSFSKNLILIFIKNTQIANLGNNLFLLFDKSKYLTSLRPEGNTFNDLKRYTQY